MPIRSSSYSSGTDAAPPIAVSYSVDGELKWSKEWRESPFRKGTVVDWKTGTLKSPLYDVEPDKPFEAEVTIPKYRHPQWHTEVFAIDTDHNLISAGDDTTLVTTEDPISSGLDEERFSDDGVVGYVVKSGGGYVYRLNDDWRPKYAEVDFNPDSSSGSVYGPDQKVNTDTDDDEPSGIITETGWNRLPSHKDSLGLEKISFPIEFEEARLEVDKDYRRNIYVVCYAKLKSNAGGNNASIEVHRDILLEKEYKALTSDEEVVDIRTLAVISPIKSSSEDSDSDSENPIIPFKVTQLEDSSVVLLTKRTHWVTRPHKAFAPLIKNTEDDSKSYYLGLDVQDLLSLNGYHSTVVKFIKLNKDGEEITDEEEDGGERPPECGHPGNGGFEEEGGQGDPEEGVGMLMPSEEENPLHDTPSPPCGGSSEADDSSATEDPPLE